VKQGTKNLGILLFFILLFGFASVSFGPEVGYDIANYHIYDGYAFLHGRIFQDAAPAGAWSYFNPLMDALTYLILSHGSAVWATFWMGAVNGLLGFFTYKLAREVFNKFQTRASGIKLFTEALNTDPSLPSGETDFAAEGECKIREGMLNQCPTTNHPKIMNQDFWESSNLYCWASVLLALTAPAVFHMVGSAHGDINSSIFILIALWLTAKNFNATGGFSLKNALWIGIFSGVAVGLKLTQAPFAFGLGIAFLGLWIVTGRFKPLMGFVLGSGLGFLVTDGWWMALLYIHYGNPLFPFYNQLFHSPFFSTEAILDPTFKIDSFSKLITLPLTLIMHHNHVNEGVILDFRLISVFVLGIIFWAASCFYGETNRFISSPFEGAGRVGGRSPGKTREGKLNQSPTTFLLMGFLCCFFLSSYVSWAFLFGIYRYAVPMQCLSGILIVYFLKHLLALLNKNPLERLGLFIVIIGFICVFTIPTVKNARPVPPGKPYVYLIHPPKIPKNSMIIMTIPDVLNARANAVSWVLPLLFQSSSYSLSAVYPNLYPENTLFWNKGYLWLKTGDSRNLSVNKILTHSGPLFLLISVDSNYLKLVERDQQRGDVKLISTGSRSCQVFEGSIEWEGKMALCEVRVEKGSDIYGKY
jgi:hypothetical protein